MSQLLDNFCHMEKSGARASMANMIRHLFVSPYSAFRQLQPEMAEIDEQRIKLGFTIAIQSDMPISKRYYFEVIFNVKKYLFLLSAKWILNELPMKTKLSQANYFYSYQAIKQIQAITGDKHLKLTINPFRQTFELSWSTFLNCDSFEEYLLISKKLLLGLFENISLKFAQIDSIINYFIIGIPINNSISLQDIHVSVQRDISKLIQYFSLNQLSSKKLQQKEILLLSNQKFLSQTQKTYLRVSEKILKLSIQGIYGGISVDNRKMLSIEVLNQSISGLKILPLQQDPCKQQIVSFINTNIKACHLQKGKKSYLKLNTQPKGKTNVSSQSTKKLLKIKIQVPQNCQEQLLIANENSIVSTFFPRFRSKHFLKYFINIANMKQFPVRMILDHKYTTLKQFLHVRQGWVSFKTKIYILRQILYGMKRLWKQGIIYLGLSSSNVLLDWNKGKMTVKIIDFGNSFHQQICANNINYKPNYKSQYLAPEFQQRVQTHQSMTKKQDIYSFGVLISQLFFYKLPKPSHVLYDQMKESILLKALAKQGMKWQQTFQQILAKLTKQCLQQCPDNRPDSQFLNLILGYLAGF